MNVQNPSASRGIVIQAVDLVKNYGTGSNMVHALRGVNVSFERGKFTAIMGPSGSGKSTLMHTLAGLDSATSGHILFGGADLTRMDDKQLTLLRRHKIGFIYQAEAGVRRRADRQPRLRLQRRSAELPETFRQRTWPNHHHGHA